MYVYLLQLCVNPQRWIIEILKSPPHRPVTSCDLFGCCSHAPFDYAMGLSRTRAVLALPQEAPPPARVQRRMTVSATALEPQAALLPPLKWAGGKRWQLPHLQPLWKPHAHRRLVEPFCGGMAVTLELAPQRAILNDINPHLISFYSWLRRGLKISIPLENDSTPFYAHRARFNDLLAAGKGKGAEAASLFYF
jgi:hypothetical protein